MDKYINENYYQLKTDLVKYCNYNGLKFDEDIFHNTIIGCMDKVNDIDNFKNYLFISFKNNLNREKQYHRNLLREELPDNYELSDNYEVSTDNTESLIEYNSIQELLRNKFGEKMLELFNKHISGYSVRELEQLYNCKQLTYKLNKMKQYCKENY